jgi:hypothetical protein
MKILAISDLWHMAKIELLAIEANIALKLAELPEGSPERSIALTNLRNIRRVLVNRAQLSRGP